MWGFTSLLQGNFELGLNFQIKGLFQVFWIYYYYYYYYFPPKLWQFCFGSILQTILGGFEDLDHFFKVISYFVLIFKLKICYKTSCDSCFSNSKLSKLFLSVLLASIKKKIVIEKKRVVKENKIVIEKKKGCKRK